MPLRRTGFGLHAHDQVATQLSDHDALGAHARDELGITDFSRAQPLTAAVASAAAFAVGAAAPMLLALLVPAEGISTAVFSSTVLLLLALGALAARLGGANLWRGAVRVAFWGVVAMAVTGVAGHYFGVAV